MGDVYSIFPSKRKGKKRYHKYADVLSRHPRFKSLIDLIGPIQPEVPIWSSIDDAVLYSIIGQMLSLSAASSIIGKLLQEFKTSSAVINWVTKTSNVRGALKGVSERKRKALCVWKTFAESNYGIWEDWKTISLNDYREQVTNIWGFGRWSADMIGIFYLGRIDIWPESDAGIKKACRLVFKTAQYHKIKRHISGCETVAAIYLWELLNRKLVNVLREKISGG